MHCDKLSDRLLSSSSNEKGYAHPAYAASLSEFGTPLHLPNCNGWLLVRPIAGSNLKDAMGCYPIFSCANWLRLNTDLAEIETDLVSLTLIPETFGEFDRDILDNCFDRVDFFKDHFVTDLSQPINDIVKKSHRATVRRAQRNVEVCVSPEPWKRLDSWLNIFSTLVKRHNIKGMRAFSKEAFASQLSIPGMVMFEAHAKDEIVGLDLWYQQGNVAYGHLVAFSDLGYELRASYATKWAVLQHFSDKVRWLDLGGGAGAKSDSDDGLTRFKRGWSTGTKPVYLCGRVFQPDQYNNLCKTRKVESSKYFPAYRVQEFE